MLEGRHLGEGVARQVVGRPGGALEGVDLLQPVGHALLLEREARAARIGAVGRAEDDGLAHVGPPSCCRDPGPRIPPPSIGCLQLSATPARRRSRAASPTQGEAEPSVLRMLRAKPRAISRAIVAVESSMKRKASAVSTGGGWRARRIIRKKGACRGLKLSRVASHPFG